MENNTTTQLSPEPHYKKTDECPDPNFAKAAKHLSGVSGKGNTRILSFDLARGFTVLCMPMIHVVMLYSTTPVQQSLLGDILGFIAEGPGAQLFMLLMGVNFALKSSKKMLPSPLGEGLGVRLILQRALLLLVAAYTLNFFKFIIPLSLGTLPQNLLAELQLQHNFQAATFFLLIGDILHFAAIAYLILFFITRTRYYPFASFLLAFAILFLSPSIWDWKTGITVIDHVIVLFNGHPPQAFFPVFPWLVYPLIGLTVGYLLKQVNHQYLLKKIGLTGIGIMIISFCFPATDTSQSTTYLPFYRTQPADTLFHIGFVLVWLSLFHWLSKKIPTNPFFKLLIFCSKNITSIYIIQWILICWCLAFTGYLQLNMISTLLWMVAITIITLLLAHALQKSSPDSRLKTPI